jgi:hypothetical protein
LSESSRILLRKRKEEGGREGEGRNDEKVRLTRKTKTSLPFLQVFVQESGNISENILVLHISLPTICLISKNPMKKWLRFYASLRFKFGTNVMPNFVEFLCKKM